MSLVIENKVTLYADGMNELQRLSGELSRCESNICRHVMEIRDTYLEVVISVGDDATVDIKGADKLRKSIDELSQFANEFRNILDSLQSASDRVVNELNQPHRHTVTDSTDAIHQS